MDLMDALQDRRSIRRYENRDVPPEAIKTLLDAAETAPSAGNLRARRYIVVTRPDLRKALAIAAYFQGQVAEAPLLIVVCADIAKSSSRYGDRGSLYAIQDADAAIMCMLLAAHSLGLGACWNGAFDDQTVKELIGLKEGVIPVAILSIGWPAEVPEPADRHEMEPVRWETE